VWAAESEAPRPAPRLTRRIVTEVAIVGGGFTGVSTAWHLRQRSPGLGIALLEARQLGHGASGRGGGQVLHGINGVTPETPRAALRVHDATSAGIDLAEELATRYAPPEPSAVTAVSRSTRARVGPRRLEGAPKHCAPPAFRRSSSPRTHSA
jgi:glycine/D-amino acid oxidase-like deaminating enzyme